MRPLALAVVAGGGRARAALVVGGTALVSGLLMVAAAVLRLSRQADADAGYGHVFTPLQTRGTLHGTAVGVLLVTVPLLALLDQVVRLGTAARERRYAALRTAGATRGDLRRWGATEVGVPAAVGAVLGIAVWWLLRQVLGAGLADSTLGSLVPRTTPGWYAAPVVGVVAGLGLAIGVRSGSRRRRAPRGRRRTPVLGLVLLLLALPLAVLGALPQTLGAAVSAVLAAIVSAVAGLVLCTPWLAQGVADVLARRSPSPAALLAARRLSLDAGAAGRAALVTGLAGLTIGVCVPMASGNWAPARRADYAYPTLLVAALAGLAVLLVVLSVAVHGTDVVITERRAYAALAATGFPVRSLAAALSWETLMATLPLGVLGALLPGLLYLPLFDVGRAALVLAGVAATAVVSVLSAVVTSLALLPVIRAAVETGTLRTE